MINSRKEDHISISLSKEVESGATGFGRLALTPRIPTINERKISLKTEFLGHAFNYPFLISSMTGGCASGKKINANLARAAQNLGIGMGVGSQRAALEDPSLADTFSIARKNAPDTFLMANIGAIQLHEYSLPQIRSAVDMISADALAIHFNPLQEAVQPEGDTDFSHWHRKLKDICKRIGVPVIAKETGTGFSRSDALLLKNAGVSAIEVAGRGGTNFALVEHHRSHSDLGITFENWGLPTLESLKACKGLPLIASGGMRSGLDAAKAIACGASLTGFALPLLEPAAQSARDVEKKFLTYATQLRTAMFLTNSKSISQLRRVKCFSS